MNRKGSAILLVAIGLALVFVAGASFYAGYKYLQLQGQIATDLKEQNSITPVGTKPVDQTANWKTYTSKTMGFEIKYPSIDTIASGDTWVRIDPLNFFIRSEPPA